MRTRKLDVILIYGDANQSGNLSYLTNFFPYADTGLFVLPVKGRPRVFTTHAYRNMPWFRTTTWIKDIICTNDIGKECVVYLESLNLSSGRIGVVTFGTLPYPIYDRLQKKLGAILVDFSSEYEGIRTIKSRNELKRVSKAAQIAVESLRRIRPILTPGISGFEIAAEIELSARKMGAEDVLCSIRTEARQELSYPTKDRMTHTPSLEIAVEYNGYWARLGRTFLLDKSDEEIENKEQDWISIYSNITSEMTSGRSIDGCIKELRERLNSRKGVKETQVRFSFGLEPYWSVSFHNNLEATKFFAQNMVLFLRVDTISRDNLNILRTDTFIVNKRRTDCLTLEE